MVRRPAKSRKTGSCTTPAAIDRQLRHTCQLRLESLLIEIHRTAAHPQADAIHDLRVAVRRGTEVLQVMKIAAIMHRPALARLVKRLQLARRAGGAVRDCDVLLQMAPHRPTQGDPNVVMERHRHALNLSRSKALTTFTHRLTAKALAPAIRQTIIILANSPQRSLRLPLPEALALRLKENKRHWTAMIRKAAKDPTDRRLHRARIAAKHWRYALELCPTGMKHDAGKYAHRLRQLKTIQELLGDVHDLDMVAVRFAGLTADNTPGRAPGKYSAWLQQTRRKRHGLIRKFFQTPLVRTILTSQRSKTEPDKC